MECLKAPPPFKSAGAVYRYGGAAADVVLRLKYGRLTRLAKPMGQEMARVAELSGPVDVVIPVPLHRKKLVARGFNQSALIGGAVARSLGIPMDTSAMMRKRSTAPQAGLSREERLTNIKGAFVVEDEERIVSKRVLLVDDVVTTATTVREASKVLVQGGAYSVEVLAFARAG